MGLDIIWCKEVLRNTYKPPNMHDTGEPLDTCSMDISVYNIDDFADRQDDLQSGYYNVTGDASQGVGPYSYYNSFRDALAEMLGYESARFVWQNYAQCKGKPFVELINFADNEGCIGPKTCAKLARDFSVFYSAAESKWTRDGSPDFLETYRLFQKAFTTAAGKGCVIFC